MDNVGVIDQFLNTFVTYIDSGFGLLGGEVGFLTTTLIVIDITLAGLFWAWGADEDIMQRLVKKTLYIGFFAWIISNFNQLASILFQSFSGLGLTASGASISTEEFLQPGRLAQVGFDAGQPMLIAAGDLLGFPGFFTNFVQIAILMLAWLVVLVAFFILAIQLFVTLIEFKLTVLAGFVLIPFALFGKTSFLAEKVLGNIVASGVKILVLAVIVGIGTGLFDAFIIDFGDNQPTIEQAMSVVLAALAMLGLGIFGPGIATGLVSGAPQLGAGAVAGTGIAAVGIGAAGFMGGRAAMGAAGSALVGGSRTTATLGGAASTAYSIGSAGAPRGQRTLPGVGGMIGAVATMAGQRAFDAGMAATEDLFKHAEKGAAAVRTAAGGGQAETAPSEATAALAPNAPPEWATRMRRSQAASHGATAAAHALRSGDSGSGSVNVSLSQDDRQ
ncbi:MAG: P-type conjugative transfer protein TrbL [Pelagibacterium sp. SCN 64-44]|nr:MAG: P-type conjugative transfer protein TrbL [Pelagibacterium sp. SCN 64-44]